MGMRSTSLLLPLALVTACVDADLLVDGKYTCRVPADCPSQFLCIDELCRDGFPHQSSSCDQCVTEQCPQALRACGEDDGCRELYACVAGCSADDPGCRTACEAASPQAVDLDTYEAMDVCRRTGCLDECIGLRGLFTWAGEACEACVQAMCHDELVACVGPEAAAEGTRIGDCERFRWCDDSIVSSPASYIDCGRRLPILDTSNALYFCHDFNCGTECNRGQTWECVGDYDWPAQSEQIPYIFTFVDAFSNVPIENLTVSASPTCAPGVSVASGVTDARGEVELELPFTFSVGFEGCLEISGDGYLETVVRHTRPYLGFDNTWTWFVYPDDAVDLVASLSGVVVDPDLGQVVVIVRDCVAELAQGVRISGVSAGTEQPVYYSIDGIPVPTADATERGEAYFFNVPPGLLDIAVTTTDGTLVSGTSFTIRAGFLHYLRLEPYTSAQVN